MENNSVCVCSYRFFPFNPIFGPSFTLVALDVFVVCEIRKLPWEGGVVGKEKCLFLHRTQHIKQ